METALRGSKMLASQLLRSVYEDVPSAAPATFIAGRPEEAAFGGLYDLQYFRSIPSRIPWNALILCIIFQFSFLAYWAYVYVIYRQRRTVVHAKPPKEQPPTDETAHLNKLRNDLYVMCGSLEHSLPHLRKGKATAGGLGKVMHIVARTHPTRITMVHPMLQQGSNLDYGTMSTEQEPLRIIVDGVHEDVRVFHQEGPRAGGPDGPEVDFLLLSHPLFESRDPSRDIYPEPMSRIETLRFYSLWNQCYAALIVRHRPTLLHMPDFHSCVAPWYAIRDLPSLKIALICHNAEYQGDISTDMFYESRKLERLASIWNLPVPLVKKHLIFEGRFNMLKAGVDFVLQRQGGIGVNGVSTHYAEEINSRYSMMWRLQVKGLDNPMLEEERPVLTEPLAVKKTQAKLEVQKLLGLKEDPHARLFVSLGRLVRMKGVDIVADVAPWLLRTYPDAQLVVIGPVADGYGVYCREKLYAIQEEFKGRLFARCEWMNVPPAIKFGADFCIMPSRDEPFGYVDIEFAWHGAVMVGAEAGGLGKVPGFYFIAQNRENFSRLRKELRQVLNQAMATPSEQLELMASQAMSSRFPLDAWQHKLLMAYNAVLTPDAVEAALEESNPPLSTVPASTPISPEDGKTFLPFTPHTPKPKHFIEALALAPSMLTEWMEGQPPPARSCAEALHPQAEFVTQELSTDELADRVKEKLLTSPELTMDAIVESIGADVNNEREVEGSMERRMLKTTCGVMRVHLFVIMGYLVAPLVDFFTIVVCTEWLLRVPFTLGPNKTDATQIAFPGLKFDSVPSIFCLFFTIQSIGFILGTPAWATLTKYFQPRRVLGANMLLQFLFFPLMMFVTASISCTLESEYNGHSTGCTDVSTGGIVTASMILLAKSLVSSGALLYLCFSFMLSLKTDVSFAALRMGGIEMIRYCITFIPIVYVLLVSPTNFLGSKTNPIPVSVIWGLLPVVIVIAMATLIPGILLFLYAPGPYRDDRFPGWEILLVGKRKSFMFLAMSDCIGALAVFPNITYLWWWLSVSSSTATVEWYIIAFVVVLVLGFAAWAKALSEASKSGLRFLAGAALLIAPPGIIRAVAQEEVSTYISSGSVPHVALIISGFSLLLEGMRTTAQWTAKIKVLDSRWRLLSYGTANIAALSFFGLLSPFLTIGVAFAGGNKLLFIGSTQPKPLADWAMLTIVPIGIIQFVVQLCAAPWIFRDMGANVVPIKQRQNPCLRILTAPALLVLGIFMIAFICIMPATNLLKQDFEFAPTHRCEARWVDSELDALKAECRVVDEVSGNVFNRNDNQQITLARYNCLQHMQQKGGNTFVLQKKADQVKGAQNICTVLSCSASPLTLSTHPTKPFDKKDNWPLEVWSRSCSAYSPHKLVGVQLMEWNWYDIGMECKHHLGPAGFDYVHVSPPTEHVVGNKAYTKYQPVNFKLNSRSGSTEEFYDMVRTCRDNNVAIMVDFIVNHLASSFPTPEVSDHLPKENDDLAQCGVNMKCKGWAGSKFGNRVYDCEESGSTDDKCNITRSFFHHTLGDDTKPSCTFATDIMKMNPLTGVEQCDPGFGADTNTEDKNSILKVQDYLLRLTDAGVTMLRVDAAQLVAATSLANIVEPFPWEFMTSEVLGWSQQTSHQFDLDERFKISTLYDWSWGAMIYKQLVNQQDYDQVPPTFTTLKDYRPPGPFTENVLDAGWTNAFPRSENVLVYVDNHDGMSRPLDYHTPHVYLQAVLFMLFHPWGTATQVMSSYWYDGLDHPINEYDPPLRDQTPDEIRRSYSDPFVNLTRRVSNVTCRVAPKSTIQDKAWLAGQCADGSGFGCNWICQHRWPGVAALTRARHLVGKNLTVTNVWANAVQGRFALSVGEVTWMFMQSSVGAEGALEQLFQPEPITTGLPGGTYCNLARLPQEYVSSLENWSGSDGERYCRDKSNKMRVEVNREGYVLGGHVPAGIHTGIVVIHTAFTV